MAIQSNFGSFNSQNYSCKSTESGMNPVSSLVNNGSYLRPLNAVFCALVPTGEQFTGVYNVRGQVEPVYLTQPDLHWPDFSVYTSKFCLGKSKIDTFCGTKKFSDSQNSNLIQQLCDYSICNKIKFQNVTNGQMCMLGHTSVHSKHASLEKCQIKSKRDCKEGFSYSKTVSSTQNSQNHPYIPAFGSSLCDSQVQYIQTQRTGLKNDKNYSKSNELSSSLKLGVINKRKNSQLFFSNIKEGLNSSNTDSISIQKNRTETFHTSDLCTCGLTKGQARLVDKVLTHKNARFIRKLRDYPYSINEAVDASTQQTVYKYVCKYKGCCNKEFDRAWNLLDHCRMHFGVKPFECHICGRKFTQKGNRNKHIARHK